MAFVRLALKAAKINQKKSVLEQEKLNAIKQKYGEKVKLNIKQKYQHFCVDICRSLRRCIKRIFSFPEHTCMHKTCYNLRHDGSCENFTLKSIVGFIGGFFLTYIFFWFFVFQLNFKLSSATIMCAVFGCILTLGLAFSYKVRSVVFLLLPQFFSKRGRQALLAYAFILAITGPAKNTLNNMSILSESLACGQEQLKDAVRQILDVIKKPFYAIKDAIKKVVVKVKEIVKKIKEILMKIKRIIVSIIKVIKAAFLFLAKIINICNKELGTPFQRCSRVFESAIADCNAKLGPMFRWMCSITYLVQGVCYIVKIFDFVCMIVDFISNSIIGVVVRKVKQFVRHIKTMFYVRIRFSHSFSFETNRSKSVNEIAEGIVTEVKHRAEGIMAIFDIMTCATSLFFMFIIFKVLHYRYKYLTCERFDNRFITRNFRDIDMKRAQLERETVLPLNHREQQLYIPVNSMRLVKIEKRKLSKSAMVLMTATIKLCTHMVTDYALYWILKMIRYHARFQNTVQAPKVPELHVSGNGMLAKLLRSIVKAFQPMGIQLEIDTVPCLPDPIPPDYDRYIQIASLLVMCWILTVAEPYGLRLRHTVMCYYHPTRAKQRAIWLYNHILRSRSSFLKFARRQLRRKVMNDKSITKITCREFLRAKLKIGFLRWFLGPDKQDACLLCGEVFREDDKIKPIRCATPGCQGMYCEQCFIDLQNLCTVCLSPVQYGDLSDISEEKDSSEEEVETRKKKQKRRKHKHKEHNKNDADDDDSDNTHSNKKLLPKKDIDSSSNAQDSDYNSDFSTSTQYSYGYQDKKDITEFQNNLRDPHFFDIEKQPLPDYASMESFREIPDEEAIQKFESSSPRSSIIKSVQNSTTEPTPTSSPYRERTSKLPSWKIKKRHLPSKKSIVARMLRRQNITRHVPTSTSSLLSDLQEVESERTAISENISKHTVSDKNKPNIEKQDNIEIPNYSRKYGNEQSSDTETTFIEDSTQTSEEKLIDVPKANKHSKSTKKSKKFWKPHFCTALFRRKKKTKRNPSYIQLKTDQENLETDTSITDYDEMKLRSRVANKSHPRKATQTPSSVHFLSDNPDSKKEEPKIPVPKLNLYFLDTESNYPGDKYNYITYETIDETPRTGFRTTTSTSSSSTERKRIQSPPSSKGYDSLYEENSEDVSNSESPRDKHLPLVRQRKKYTSNLTYPVQDTTSESSNITDVDRHGYNERAKKYYKSIGNDSESLIYHKRLPGKRKVKRQNPILKFFSNLFQKEGVDIIAYADDLAVVAKAKREDELGTVTNKPLQSIVERLRKRKNQRR